MYMRGGCGTASKTGKCQSDRECTRQVIQNNVCRSEGGACISGYRISAVKSACSVTIVARAGAIKGIKNSRAKNHEIFFIKPPFLSQLKVG